MLPSQVHRRGVLNLGVDGGPGDLNRTRDVDQLCKDFPERLRQLVKRKGDRLNN